VLLSMGVILKSLVYCFMNGVVVISAKFVHVYILFAGWSLKPEGYDFYFFRPCFESHPGHGFCYTNVITLPLVF
jgi:hypothetical protein